MAEYVNTNLLIEKMSRLRGCSCHCSDGIIDDVEDILSDISTTNVIVIPDNVTLGDVIQAIFPNAVFTEYGGRMKCDGIFVCDDGRADLVPLHILETVETDIDRWNTPYKVESER